MSEVKQRLRNRLAEMEAEIQASKPMTEDQLAEIEAWALSENPWAAPCPVGIHDACRALCKEVRRLRGEVNNAAK